MALELLWRATAALVASTQIDFVEKGWEKKKEVQRQIPFLVYTPNMSRMSGRAGRGPYKNNSQNSFEGGRVKWTTSCMH